MSAISSMYTSETLLLIFTKYANIFVRIIYWYFFFSKKNSLWKSNIER